MNWRDTAACRPGTGVDPQWFQDPSDAHKALAVCAECPVRQPCLQDRAKWDAQGVWGGILWVKHASGPVKPSHRFEVAI